MPSKPQPLLSHITELPPRDFVPVGRRGKLKKDDLYWQSVREYLHDKYLEGLGRKGSYKPRQIARNFFK